MNREKREKRETENGREEKCLVRDVDEDAIR